MSLVKAVPEGIKDKECKRFALGKCPPVPYVPEKGPIQETVSALKSNQSLKTTIRDDMELHWEAFLMYISTAVNAVKKRGTFNAHAEASGLYVEHHEAAKQAKAALVVLNNTTSEGEKTSKKASQKTKKGMALADTPDPELSAEYEKDLEKAKFAAETPKNKKESAAKEMFQFYANLLSADA